MDQRECCAVCGIASKLQCGVCMRVRYCGAEHQRQDWTKKHRDECFPYGMKLERVDETMWARLTGADPDVEERFSTVLDIKVEGGERNNRGGLDPFGPRLPAGARIASMNWKRIGIWTGETHRDATAEELATPVLRVTPGGFLRIRAGYSPFLGATRATKHYPRPEANGVFTVQDMFDAMLEAERKTRTTDLRAVYYEGCSLSGGGVLSIHYGT